jgi:hypothetical protein
VCWVWVGCELWLGCYGVVVVLWGCFWMVLVIVSGFFVGWVGCGILCGCGGC